MKNLYFKHINDVIEDYDYFIFDLWGVVIEGDFVYPGVVETINDIINLHKKQVFFMSNAPRPSYKIIENLQKWGVKNVVKQNVITSGDIARNMLNDKEFFSSYNIQFDQVKIFHLGRDRNSDVLLNITHETTSDINLANVLLLTLYRDDHENIEEFNDIFLYAVNNNILSICANPDVTLVNKNSIRYCPGYFSKKIEEYGGNVIYTGKPKIEIYSHLFDKIKNINKKRTLMIGDTLETDIIGARNAGINSALVITGNTKLSYQNFCSKNSSIEQKLQYIKQHINDKKIIPNFITALN